MKPGDIVQLISETLDWPPIHRGSRIGMIVGFDETPLLANPILVLIDGKIMNFNPYELRLVNEEGVGYDGTKENT